MIITITNYSNNSSLSFLKNMSKNIFVDFDRTITEGHSGAPPPSAPVVSSPVLAPAPAPSASLPLASPVLAPAPSSKPLAPLPPPLKPLPPVPVPVPSKPSVPGSRAPSKPLPPVPVPVPAPSGIPTPSPSPSPKKTPTPKKPLSNADYVEVPFKKDPWSFYRSLMRGYLIYSDSSDTGSPKAGRILRVGEDNDIRNMLNVFTFDDIVITECDMIFGMLSRISTWAKEKLNANIPGTQGVESGGDYYMEQLKDFFTQTKAHHGTDSIDFLKKLTEIDLKLAIRSGGGRQTIRRDNKHNHNNIKASSSSRTTRKNHTQSGGIKPPVWWTLMRNKDNADKKIWNDKVRENIRNGSSESLVAGDNSEPFMTQLKKTNIVSEEPPKSSFLARVLPKKISPSPPPPPPPPSLTLEDYFEKIAVPIKRPNTTITYSEIVPEVWGHPLLMLVPFARAMQCNIELYRKDSSGDFKLKACINCKNREDTTETEMTIGEVTIRILDNNTNEQAYHENVLEYMSNFALIVSKVLYNKSGIELVKKEGEINKEELIAKETLKTSRDTKKSMSNIAELKEVNAQLETLKEDLYNLTITHPAYSTLDKKPLKDDVSRILKDYKPETGATVATTETMPHESETKEESKNSKWWSTSYSSDDLVRTAKEFNQTMKNKIRENISKPRLILRLKDLISKHATLSAKKDQLTAEKEPVKDTATASV